MPAASTTRCRAGVDIGGTSTDLIIVDDTAGEFVVDKTLSNQADPSQAVEAVLDRAILSGDFSIETLGAIVHGTTLVTNAPRLADCVFGMPGLRIVPPIHGARV